MKKLLGIGIAGVGGWLLWSHLSGASSPFTTREGEPNNSADTAGSGSPTTLRDQMLIAIRAQNGQFAAFPANQSVDQWNYWYSLASGKAAVPFEDLFPDRSDRNSSVSFDSWALAMRRVGAIE